MATLPRSNCTESANASPAGAAASATATMTVFVNSFMAKPFPAGRDASTRPDCRGLPADLGAILRRFKQQDRAQPAVGADADDGARSPGHRRQFLHRLADDARTGGAERMAQRHAAAVGVEAFPGERSEVAGHLGPVAQEGGVLQCLQVK